jgi:Arc/MetJ-type ribon-helix-helix transcriptional regulator
MDVVLAPEVARKVEEAVSCGRFPSADALVAEAIRLLLAPDQVGRGDLDALIQVGIDEADRGEFVSGDEVRTEIAELLRRRSDG